MDKEAKEQLKALGLSRRKIRQYRFPRIQVIGLMVVVIVVLDFVVKNDYGIVSKATADGLHNYLIAALLVISIAVIFGLSGNKFVIPTSIVLMPAAQPPPGMVKVEEAPHELTISIKYETKDAFVVGRKIKASVEIIPNLKIKDLEERVKKTSFQIHFPSTTTDIVGPYPLDASVTFEPSKRSEGKNLKMHDSVEFMRTRPGMLTPEMLFLEEGKHAARKTLDFCSVPIEQLSVLHTLMNNRVVLGLSIIVIALALVNLW